MIDLSEAQIAAAKDNDLGAVTAVVKATEERVNQLAWKYATGGGRTDHTLAEDLAQVGRIAIWDGLKRFNGTTVAEFFTFIDRTLKGAMSDSRKEETRQGVSRSVAAAFERALSIAGGDPYEAEWMATTPEAMGDRRLSAEMAYAARLSYQGLEYLDAPLGETDMGESVTLADRLAVEAEVPADLLEPNDYAKERSKRTGVKVRKTLSRMGKQHRVVLMALTGIVPVDYYGTERDEELSRDYGIPLRQVRIVRSKAKDRFAELWTAAA
ncbi:sigma factor [Streptomyces uncialis]|uniref:sigma factor n=1 Tax=Streptomyces uncialis TaxID=1048205 RepID=UPI00093F88EB|nr:sigma factor [Streptomyces uncialis]